MQTNLGLEQSVIGYCILYPEKSFEVITSLEPGDFSEQSHQVIFTSIYQACNEGQTPESQITIDYLTKTGNSHLLDYYASLSDEIINVPNISYAIDRIKRNTAKQKLHQHSRELYDNTQDETQDVENIISDHLNKITDLTPKTEHIAPAQISVQRFKKEIQERQLMGDGVLGIESGIKSLDNFTQGYRKTAMVTVAAATGAGKTYMCLNTAIHNALQGLSVLYFSLEMLDTELMYRTLPMLRTTEKIEPKELIKTKYTEDEQEQIDLLLSKYNDLKFTIDWGTRNIDKILLTCEKQKRSKDGLDVVFIDHLQLLSGTSDYATFATITGKIKNYALKNSIPMICASQLNRQNAVRANKLPMLSDLRGSGTIEQDSDTIIFLHKDKMEDQHTKLIVGKHRQATAAVGFMRELMFDPRNNKLVEQLGLTPPKKNNYFDKDKGRDNPYDEVGF